MTRRRLFGLSLAPLFAPLAALWPWRKREPAPDCFYAVSAGTDLGAEAAEWKGKALHCFDQQLIVVSPFYAMTSEGHLIPWEQPEAGPFPVGYAKHAAQEGEIVAVRLDHWPRA